MEDYSENEPFIEQSFEKEKEKIISPSQNTLFQRVFLFDSLSFFWSKHCSWFRNWFCFCLLGLINNTPYVVVIAAGKSLAEFFFMENYFGFIMFANISMGILSGILNAFFLSSVKHMYRVIGMCFLFIVGLCGVNFVTLIFGPEPNYSPIGFWMTVFFILFISGSTQFGESLCLGYMKVFDKANCIGGWGLGTGGAGICGTLLYLLFNSINLPLYYRFVFFVPWIFVYLLVFAFGIKEPTEEERLQMKEKEEKKKEEEQAKEEEKRKKKLLRRKNKNKRKAKEEEEEEEEEGGGGGGNEDDNEGFLVSLKDESSKELLLSPKDEEKKKRRRVLWKEDFSKETDVTLMGELFDFKYESNVFQRMNRWIQRLSYVLWYIWFPASNVFLVYWFEYVISTCFAEKIYVPPSEGGVQQGDYWQYKNSYEILAFCYQFGVIISRSSLRVVRIKWVWIMTIIQFCFMIIWFIFAKWKLMTTPVLIWFLFVFMIFVGLLGGASYVNCYYLILNHKKLNEKDREFSANVTAIWNTVGITLASLTTIFFDFTFLRTNTSS